MPRGYHVYAMVNNGNGLPVLVFDEWLPNTDDPPSKRGPRLLTARMTQLWWVNPAGYPWVKSKADIPAHVEKHFRLVEVHLGLVIEETTVGELRHAGYPSLLQVVRSRFGRPMEEL